MKRTLLWALVALVWAAVPATSRAQPAALAALKPVAACETLSSVIVSQATGQTSTLSSAVVADAPKPYCKVSGVIAPEIAFEVRLPMQAWTQRLLVTGCGGLCGMLAIRPEKAEGCVPVTDGAIVLASSNMGHSGRDMAWGADQQKRADFAQRGMHLTTLAAKALIAKFYGRAQRYSYFSGCSDGGREALIAAQRYPEDFDGIAAGAPALNFTLQNSFYHAWMAKSNTGADGNPLLTAVDLPPLHEAVVKACDKLDGLENSQIDDPRKCKFDPATIQCKLAYETGKCLTADQVAAVRKLFAGPRDEKGRALLAGSVMPGSELMWAGVFVPRKAGDPIMSRFFALDTINNLLFTPNPAKPYTIGDFPFTAAMKTSLEPARVLYNADDPNLAPFAKHGGKLILWHGWSDAHISPLNSIRYYEAEGKAMGQARRDAAMRLFLLPGMGHCGGGEFPLLAALMDWVERGKGPQSLLVRRADNGSSRLTYAWPGNRK